MKLLRSFKTSVYVQLYAAEIQKLHFFETSLYVKLPSTKHNILEDQNSQSTCFGLTGPTRGGNSIHFYLIKSVHLYATNGILYLTNGIRLLACYKEHTLVSDTWYTPVSRKWYTLACYKEYTLVYHKLYTLPCTLQRVYTRVSNSIHLHVTKSIQKPVKLQGQCMRKLISEGL